jgi:hypothetical protein
MPGLVVVPAARDQTRIKMGCRLAGKIRGIIAATLSPDHDMIANNDPGDAMPRH